MCSLQLSYRSFWSAAIVEVLIKQKKRAVEIPDEHALSVSALSQMTSIRKEDVISTLQVSFCCCWPVQPPLESCDGAL